MTPTGTAPMKTAFRGVEILALRHPSKKSDTNSASALEQGGTHDSVAICTRLVVFYGKTGIGMKILGEDVEKARTSLSGTTRAMELVNSKMLEVWQELDVQLKPGPDCELAEKRDATDFDSASGEHIVNLNHEGTELQLAMLFLVFIVLKASELSLKDKLKLYQNRFDELQETFRSLETHERRAAEVFERVQNCQHTDSGDLSWGLRRCTGIIVNLFILVWVVSVLLTATFALVYVTQYEADSVLATIPPQTVAGWCTRKHEGWYLYRALDSQDDFVHSIYRQVLEKLGLA